MGIRSEEFGGHGVTTLTNHMNRKFANISRAVLTTIFFVVCNSKHTTASECKGPAKSQYGIILKRVLTVLITQRPI